MNKIVVYGTAWHDDVSKPSNGSHFADLRHTRQDTEHFDSRQKLY